MEIFKTLPGENTFNNKDEEFFELLPSSFKTAELAPLQAKLKVSEKTIERKLRKFVESKKLINPKRGYYEKIEVSVKSDDASAN